MFHHRQSLLGAIVLALAAPCLFSQARGPRTIDPAFLHRSIDTVPAKPSDLSTPTARYKPLFGVGDSQPRLLKGIVRYGELIVDPGGTSEAVSYPEEEQLYYVLGGTGQLLYGDQKVPLRANDFVYLPVNVKHGIANPSSAPIQVMVMGFHIPGDMEIKPTPKLMMANIDDVAIQPTHGPGSKFKLLVGDKGSSRDKLAAAHIITSLYTIEFDPGIDNFPHHHDQEEEIYYILKGTGEMATGAGPDGAGNRYPVKAGDAYFFRVNATVGFYRSKDGENPVILAVRSRYPFERILGSWSPIVVTPEPKRKP